MKRIVLTVLALLLAATPALAVTPATATCDCEGYTYVILADGTAKIVCWDGPERAIKVPEALDGHVVTSVSECAFADCAGLEQVILPETVREIGEGAFSNCVSLDRVVLPEGLVRIGSQAFERCQVLTSIDLPASVAEVGENPFRGCTNLCSIHVAEDHPYLTVVDGVLFSRPDNRLVCYPMGKSDTRYAVPEGVRSIGAMAFDSDLYVEEIVLPKSLMTIGREAFNGCRGLRTMNLPAGVQYIGEAALLRCSNLVLTLEEDVTCVPQLVMAGDVA